MAAPARDHPGNPVELPERPVVASRDRCGTRPRCALSVAATAGVVEEAAFRGYMLSIIEARHGWVAGILIVALLFYAAHLSHAYATIAFLPFFMAYSLLLERSGISRARSSRA